MENNTLIVASNNAHKINELKEMLSGLPFEVLSLKDAGIDIDVEENGTTFKENAYIKAKTIYDYCHDKYKNVKVLADDSGLMVDALGGAPGVYSARFAGEHGNSEKNNEKLLKLLQGKKQEERKAKFACALVLILDENETIEVEGRTEGFITEEYNGHSGFGYDPLFYYPEFKMTFAEMTPEQKNSISHRGKAIELLKNELKKKLNLDK